MLPKNFADSTGQGKRQWQIAVDRCPRSVHLPASMDQEMTSQCTYVSDCPPSHRPFLFLSDFPTSCQTRNTRDFASREMTAAFGRAGFLSFITQKVARTPKRLDLTQERHTTRRDGVITQVWFLLAVWVYVKKRFRISRLPQLMVSGLACKGSSLCWTCCVVS